MNSEYANQNAYDCIQVHGGSGFMLEYACQRIYRDARITSIYEGTTQLQTVAAIRYVTNGSYLAALRDYEQVECSEEMKPLMERIKAMTDKFEACTNLVKEAGDQELHDLIARRLYEMAADCVMSHLIIQDAGNVHTVRKGLCELCGSRDREAQRLHTQLQQGGHLLLQEIVFLIPIRKRAGQKSDSPSLYSYSYGVRFRIFNSQRGKIPFGSFRISLAAIEPSQTVRRQICVI